MIPETTDRLRIFVSSTIKECSEERVVAREAILSINHDPVLFEKIGARPYPPRVLYKARLEMSQIFIGIYRESYGWVAPDMEISGIEDEFFIATERGLDRLIYAYRTPASRDPRLEALIGKAKNSGLVFATYSTAEELRERVRNDVTAIISGRFVDQAIVSRETPTANEVLESLLPNQMHRLRRREVEANLVQALQKGGRLLVNAPLGGGKTILVAQLAADNNWIFIDGQGLSRLDLRARIANAVRQRLGQRPITLSSEQRATQELLAGFESLGDATLVVDGAEEPVILWTLPVKKWRIVLTSRSRFEVPVQQRFEIPPLTREEIAAWVTALRGSRPEPGELVGLVERSGGNPLYLRFYALGGNSSSDLSLRELEVRAVQSLPSRAREITSYVTLSSRTLSLKDLQALAGSDKGPEDIAEQLAMASGMISQTRGHVQLVHEHLRATLLEQLRQSPTRLAFFAGRLGRHFEQSERFVAAFHAYLEAGELRHVNRLLTKAAHEAILMGGGGPAVAIFRRQADVARENGHVDEQINALLALASALKQTGARDEAAQVLANARLAAEHEKDKWQILRVIEFELVLDLTDRPRAERIGDLAALQQSYADAGDAFNVARIKTLLAAEYMTGNDYLSAEKLSRDALEAFNSLGDEYGIRLARVNLAAALSGIKGREREAAVLAQELQKELDPEEHPRERAVLCNFLTHYYREQGDTARASEFANEALQIGQQLKDQHIIVINTINLGNVRRDEGKIEEALDQYRGAELIAVEGGLRKYEAAANELIASILNQSGQHVLALEHAEHASALARIVGDPVLVARSEEERAIALKEERDIPRAMSAYTEAAKAIAGLRSESSRFVSLVVDALDLTITSQRIDLRIELLRDIFAPNLKPIVGADKIYPLHALYAALPQMAKTIKVSRLLPIVVLSMADLLADTSTIVKRRIVRQAIDALLSGKPRVPSPSVQAAVAAILMARSGAGLTQEDLVYLSERLAKSSANLYFKPQSDGAAHWTVRLEIGAGVTVTLMQLDSKIDTGVTATILALLLASLDGMIRRRLLEAEQIPRTEATIYVCSRKDLEASLGREFLNLGDMPNRFAVSESTDISREDQPPIALICSEDFVTSWNPHEHAFSGLHSLFAELLRVLVAHLLAKAIEPEVLFPKISNLVREIGYLDAADANSGAKP